jgi:hypothetical protein
LPFAKDRNDLQAFNGYLKPAAAEVGLQIGGWHDLRHTLNRTLLRAGVHPVVIKDFFTLWKDADPDIPVLKEAKTEYAKLQ